MHKITLISTNVIILTSLYSQSLFCMPPLSNYNYFLPRLVIKQLPVAVQAQPILNLVQLKVNHMRTYITFNNQKIDLEQLTEEQYLNLLDEDNINNGILNANMHTEDRKSKSTLSLVSWLLRNATRNKDSIITKSPKLQDRLVRLITDNKIPKTTLTQLVMGDKSDFILITSRVGQTIITEHPELQAKLADLISNSEITAAALNQIVAPNNYLVAPDNYSALYCLIASKIGQTIITKYPKLQAKLAGLISTGEITAATLNQIIGPYNGSVLYGLLATPAGQTIITKHPKLQAKIADLIISGGITVATLNQLVGPRNYSVLYYLLVSPAGQIIFTKYPELQAKLASLISTGEITAVTLNQLVGLYNCSVLYALLVNPACQAILTEHHKLQVKLANLIIDDKISIVALCGFGQKNYPALYYLLNTKAGKAICDNNPELELKIHELILKYNILAIENKKLFDEKLERSFPDFDKIFNYIYGSPAEKDEIAPAERERRINAFIAKITGEQPKRCSITQSEIILPAVITLANGKQQTYELNAIIESIKQTNIKNIGTLTGNVIASVVYQKLYQNFYCNQAIDLSEYNIQDPNTKLRIASITFDVECAQKIYATAKDLAIADSF